MGFIDRLANLGKGLIAVRRKGPGTVPPEVEREITSGAEAPTTATGAARGRANGTPEPEGDSPGEGPAAPVRKTL